MRRTVVVRFAFWLCLAFVAVGLFFIWGWVGDVVAVGIILILWVAVTYVELAMRR
jgi:hypothetical protein